jgi:hypothetical protein
LTLYTICILDRPTVVISANATPIPSAATLADPARLEAFQDVQEKRPQFGPEILRGAELMEIEEALDTWLGEEILNLKRHGKRVWNGNRSVVRVREANAQEVSQWEVSREAAIDAGEFPEDDDHWQIVLPARPSGQPRPIIRSNPHVMEVARGFIGDNPDAARAAAAMRRRGVPQAEVEKEIARALLGCLWEAERGLPDRMAAVLNGLKQGKTAELLFPDNLYSGPDGAPH